MTSLTRSRFRRWPGAFVLVAGLIVFCAPQQVWALLGARNVADRASVEPLRKLDLKALLSGNGGGAWKEAAAKLPARCKTPEILSRKDCHDDLRCGWLGARAKVARAFSGEVVRGRGDAASFLHRAAQRLSVGGVCGKNAARRAAWEADRKAAAEDDALVHLALVSELWGKVSGPLLESGPQREVAALVEKVAAEGLVRQDPARIVPHAQELRSAWERGRWLVAHPVVARLRQTVPHLWAPAGGVPAGCGEKLSRPELLDDQWRGYLVREVIAGALSCIADRLPEALAARGRPVASPRDVQILARGLATVAARDRGGRTFSADRALLGRIDELAARCTPSTRSAVTHARTRPKSRRAKAPARSRKKGRQPSGKRARSKATPTRPSTTRPRRRSTPGQRELVRWAKRVEALVGTRRGLVRDARKARDRSSQERELKRLVVTAHRALCAPLEALDPEDIEAVRRGFSEGRLIVDERGCDAAEGRVSLEQLLSAASGLERLAAAARMRGAARDVARGQPVRARHTLDAVKEEWRGTTWIVLYAWAARQEGDPVTADRVLSRLDEGTLDRLRASGSEELARLVAHACVSRAP